MLTLHDVSMHESLRMADKAPRVRLFLVDHNELERIGMRMVLGQDAGITILGEERSWVAAAPKIEKLRPDVVVIDLSGPEGARPALLQEIFDVCRDRRVLFLAHRFEEATLGSVVRAGSHGCLLKDVRSEDLTSAVHAIGSGQSVIDPRLTQALFGLVRDLRDGKGKKTPLSSQERRLLPLLAQGLTNKEIAREMKLSDKTVKNYLVNIYKKLNISRRSQAAAIYSRSTALDHSFVHAAAAAPSGDAPHLAR
ncbi:MAG: response regulator transcription factor [Nitrospiraceae bacterium]